MGHEGYGTEMNTMEDHIYRDSLTEVITKYAECETQAESYISQTEANFEEKLAMIMMEQPTHQQ